MVQMQIYSNAVPIYHKENSPKGRSLDDIAKDEQALHSLLKTIYSLEIVTPSNLSGSGISFQTIGGSGRVILLKSPNRRKLVHIVTEDKLYGKQCICNTFMMAGEHLGRLAEMTNALIEFYGQRKYEHRANFPV